MKRILIPLVILSAFFSLSAQEVFELNLDSLNQYDVSGLTKVGNWIYYYDETDQECSIEKAQILRLIKYDTKGQIQGMAKNYSNRNKILFSEQIVVEGDTAEKFIPHGLCTYYSKKGKVDSLGYFYDGAKYGQWKYYSNGTFNHEKYYNENVINSANDAQQVFLMYYGSSNLTGCEHIGEQWKKLALQEEGENSESLMNANGYLGVIYFFDNRYDKALSCFLETKKSLDQNVTEDETFYANYSTTLNNIGNSYRLLNDYKESLYYFVQASEFDKEKSGEESLPFAYSNLFLGHYYRDIGDLEKALIFYQKCFDIRSKLLRPDDFLMAEINICIFQNYLALDYIKEASEFSTTAKKTMDETYGSAYRDWSVFYGALSLLELKKGNIELAENYSKAAFEDQKYKKSYRQYRLLSRIEQEKGDLKMALQYANEASDKAREESNAKELVDFNNTLASIYTKTKNKDEIGIWTKEAFPIVSNFLDNTIYLSEFEKEKIIRKDLQNIINLVHTYQYSLTTASSSNYDTKHLELITLIKSYNLNSEIHKRKYLQSITDEGALQKYDEMESLKELRGRMYTNSKHNLEKLEELNFRIESLEKELFVNISGFGDFNNQPSISQLQKSLSENQAIVEFYHFNDLFDENKKDSYGAYILTRNSNPVMVPLFKESEIAAVLNYQNNNADGKNLKFINEVYGSIDRGLVKEIKTIKSLYDLIWRPLEVKLKDKTEIYYSSSGFLSRINLNAIAIDDENILADKYDMTNLLNSNSIIIKPEQIYTGQAYLLGGIEYELSEKITSISNQNKKEETYSDIEIASRGGKWIPLNASLKEIEFASEKLKAKGFEVEMRKSDTATEEDFKKIGVNKKSPRIIHIATHGYFFSDPKQSKASNDKLIFKVSEQPLLRSGLILSGGNHVWEGNNPISGKEDGILTAYEISNMNLSNTELVVLSACETGLGDIKGSEGVYGLQRAFKMAGAKYIIMSLWSVPDKQTSEFMKAFYTNWQDNQMTIRDAFNKTQLEMRERFISPYNWAGFVLIE